jgi:sugar phosphate isomerase/epimerase
MKLGFGTLGMPEWSPAKLAMRASELGYDGVSLRCRPPRDGKPAPGSQLSSESTNEEIDEMKQIFAQAGVEIPWITCGNSKGGRMDIDSNKIDWDEVQAELTTYVRVADRLGCKYIGFQVERADEKPRADLQWDWDDYLDNLGRASLGAIKGTNLGAMYQNHVSSSTAGQLFQMVEKLGDERLGVILSPDHCLVMQEDAVQLAKDHGQAVRVVYMADRRPVKEGLGDFDGRYYYVRYETCVIGEGVVPNVEVLNTLGRQNWNGYVTLKWEKSDQFGWQLPEGEVVLPSFIEYARSLDVVGSRA